MSETRQAWKPWRAKTRTPRPGSAGACRGAAPAHRRPLKSARAPAVSSGQRYARDAGSRARARRRTRPCSRGRSRPRRSTRRRGLGEDLPQGRRSSSGRRSRIAAAPGHLPRGDDERLGLDRAGAQQQLPVVLAGLQGEGRRDSSARPAHRRSVELRKAQVVADRQPEGASERAAIPRDDLLARLRSPTRGRAPRPRPRRTCGSCGSGHGSPSGPIRTEVLKSLGCPRPARRCSRRG